MKNNIWLIDRTWFQKYASDRITFEQTPELYEAGLLEELKAQREQILSVDTETDTATIRISGPLSENGPDFFDLFFGYGGVAYSEWIAALEQADRELSVNGKIKMYVNTPGGEVSGVETTANKVREIAAHRTVDTIAVSLMASAGIWTTAYSSNIISEGKATLIGSVGVATMVVDWSEYYDAAGVKVYHLTNDASADKRPDIATEGGRAVVVERLNEIYKVFIDSVVEGRGNATSRERIEALKGVVVTGERALQVGFVDGIGEKVFNKSNAPAKIEAGNMKGKDMKLADFLKENPEANTEFQKSLADARDEGASQEREKLATRAKQVLPIIKSNAYDEYAKEAGIKAIVGERTMESFTDFVALIDNQKERAKSEGAIEISEEVEVQVENPVSKAAEEVQTEVDARVAKIKALNP